jgi:hypothetical protein
VLDDEERIQPVQGDGVEVEQSHAGIASVWARRNSVHDGPARRVDGSMPAACRVFQTVEAPIW